mmetsp:Transcript_118344/g.379365  ORF Transcript_118344/g.379365 Transcript_118344/m.379365 type:complete len:97 (-) Transcript_118344:7-297(-)
MPTAASSCAQVQCGSPGTGALILPALDGGCTMHPRGSAARATFTWLGLLKVLLRCRGLLLPHADQGGVHPKDRKTAGTDASEARRAICRRHAASEP